MYKVRFWSELLDKEVIQTFSNYEEAWLFANKYNGILFI